MKSARYAATIAMVLAALLTALTLMAPAEAARSVGKPYKTEGQVMSIMDGMMRSNPGLIKKESIGRDIDGEPIYVYKIGHGGWRFMFDGRMHGPEDCGTETGLKYVQWVVNDQSSEAKKIRQNSQLLFIPVLNDEKKRQNDRERYGGTRVKYGVDLNRNFPSRWGRGGSGNPSDRQYYRGKWAGSEPETKALTSAFRKYRPDAYLNAHCGMEGLWTVQKDAEAAKFKSKIKSISARTGASTTSIYKPRSFYTLSDKGGYATLEAAKYGASSWLFEISKWSNMPSTASGYHAKWYKHAKPVYLALSTPSGSKTSVTREAAVKRSASKAVSRESSKASARLRQVFNLDHAKVQTRGATFRNDVLSFKKKDATAWSYARAPKTGKLEVDATIRLSQLKHSYIVYAKDNFLLQLRPGGKGGKSVLQAGVYSSGRWMPLVESDFAPRVGRHYSVKFRLENNRANLYVNGKLHDSKRLKSAPNRAALSRVYLGNDENRGRDFRGQLKDVRISV